MICSFLSPAVWPEVFSLSSDPAAAMSAGTAAKTTSAY